MYLALQTANIPKITETHELSSNFNKTWSTLLKEDPPLKLVLQPKLTLESYTVANPESKDLLPSVHTDTKR